MQLWGGVECTVNRVGDRYFDQVERSGHSTRLDDLDRFATLGIAALRFPALWERLAPDSPDSIDWSWTDAALERLRALRVRPIVGFVHHGSGPRYTSLLDERFAQKLARYARAFAERYPWVDAYTPVNEPVTTARFSGLYGLWYPHARDTRSFLRILMNECRGITLAMHEVRAVNPRAQLVQTEDLGRAFSTPILAYQARFENERRWLGFDLLTGRVDSQHPLYKHLVTSGLVERELAAFRDTPCVPDVVGINHYVTSNRFIDEDLAQYPACAHGGNGRHRYADVEAVRVGTVPFFAPSEIFREAWLRYGLPVALTEAHIGCTRDEQMRWLVEIWNAASAVRTSGVDMRAVTAWSLLGAYDWDSLVTRDQGHYESGVFDVRGSRPRATALTGVLRELAAGTQPTHKALETRGWWRRTSRALYRKSASVAPDDAACASRTIRRRGEILITGARGTLARAYARLCEQRGLAFRLLDREMLDIADAQSVEQALAAYAPWAVINAAGYCRVDDAEREREACHRDNALGPAMLARACAARGVSLVTFSSDLVFDGRSQSPYRESDAVAPLCVYGRSKADGERDVLDANPSALVVRTSAFFGPWDDYNFVTITLRNLASGARVTAADDLTISPTYVPDLVNASLDLMIDGACGIWHLANVGETTWAEFGKRSARLHGYDPDLVMPVSSASLGLAAVRPTYSALATERGSGLMPGLDCALERHAAESRIP